MEHFNFKGKVAIITGGASGIGAATARKLASGGAILSLIDLNGDGLKTVAEECANLSGKFNSAKPFVFIGDLTDDAVCQKFVDDTLKQFGKLDILINNAGVSTNCSILEPSMRVADKLFSLMLRSPYNMCRLTASHLSKTKGCIINVASICGHTTATRSAAYSASKAGVLQLTRSLADELGPYNVRVNSVSPGPIKTNITISEEPQPVHIVHEMLEATGLELCTMRRCGQPEEIANVIAFLASDESSFMTGSDILADGGLFAKGRYITPTD